MNKKMLSLLIAGFLLAGIGFNTQSIAAPYDHKKQNAQEKIYKCQHHKQQVQNKQKRPDFGLRQTPRGFNKQSNHQNIKKWDNNSKYNKKEQKQNIKNIKKEHKQKVKAYKKDKKNEIKNTGYQYQNRGYHKGIQNGQKSFGRGQKSFNNGHDNHRQYGRR